MKRKFLEDLGLEKDAIDKIMAENGNDVNAAKADYEAMKQQLDTVNTQIQERDKQLETLRKSSGDNEALQKQITDLQAENKAAKEKYEADMKELKLTTAIKLAIGDAAHDAGLVAGLVDKGKLVLNEDGTVAGLEEQVKAIKKDKAFLFKEEKTGAVIKGGKPAEGAGTPPADKKPSEMTYEELCAYMEANPGAPLE